MTTKSEKQFGMVSVGYGPVAQWNSFSSLFGGRWFDLWVRSWYTLLTRTNKVETAIQWSRMSRAELAAFSEHGNSIYNRDFIISSVTRYN